MLRLREGTDNDALLVMTWRSNPIIYAGFLKQTSPLTWENHLTYWKKLKNWKHWIILYGEGEYERPVGQINIQMTNTDCPEIGYFIGEIPLWGRGIATASLKLVLNEIKKLGFNYVCADIKEDNLSSIKVVEKLGFKSHNGRDGLKGFIKSL